MGKDKGLGLANIAVVAPLVKKQVQKALNIKKTAISIILLPCFMLYSSIFAPLYDEPGFADE